MSWREDILGEFPPQGRRLTLAADPDYLLTEEAVAADLSKRGYETLEYSDPIAFRYTYEANYRARWKAREQASLVVVIRGEARDLDRLPYDLLRAGHKLSFGLTDLFPNLSHPVVDALDRTNLERLREAYRAHAPDRLLGEHATSDFVLRHVYGVAPETITSDEDLLRLLLRRHYEAWELPDEVEARLLRDLRDGGRFEEWPLEEILLDRDAFLAFLQERWPIFLHRTAEKAGLEVRETSAVYETSYSGPKELPFDGAQMRVYIDNMFLEGMLRPTSHSGAEHLKDGWLAVGLKTEPGQDKERRLDGLLKNVRDTIPEPQSDRHGWLSFAHKWAELEALRHEMEISKLDYVFTAVRTKADASFLEWVTDKYGGLHNLSATSPAMVHHVPRFLVRRPEEGVGKKVALIVVDGLSLEQWVVLRESLAKQMDDVRLHEDAVFAWAPTITPVSRQAIFAGSPPAYFPASIDTTAREKTLWRRFWSDSAQLSSGEVAYVNVTGDGDTGDIEDAVSGHRVRAAGIVVRKVDEIMHGMELGARGMHNQVKQWTDEGFMGRLAGLLLRRGFEIYLTSDHGNVEAEGIGRPSEGAIAGVRGERTRVYADASLRERVAGKFPGAIEWPGPGLPPDYLPLLAPNRTAFVSENKRIVSHGGISMEELIVPFINIEGERLNGDQRAIGFDRKIRLGWLDATANWVAEGASAQEIRAKLDLFLEGEIRGEAARKKTKGVLLRTWLLTPEHLKGLRDEGLSLMTERSDRDRLALHWGMVCTNYPVVWETAGVIGRLLRLQEKVSMRQVRQRLVEAHGERSTIIRASQRIIRSFADWSILRETSEKGEYIAAEKSSIDDIETTAWLLEAALISSGSNMSVLPIIVSSPALFPFDISCPDELTLRQSSRLELYRQGCNEDLISLRTI